MAYKLFISDKPSKASERIVAILCDYRFDPEHGIAIVYKNETFGYIDEEGAVI